MTIPAALLNLARHGQQRVELRRYRRTRMKVVTPGAAIMSRSELPVTRAHANGRSPTAALLVGLMITLATVVAYSWYISGQISGLRRLQTDLADRNRRDSLQLLRIQNDLNSARRWRCATCWMPTSRIR